MTGKRLFQLLIVVGLVAAIVITFRATAATQPAAASVEQKLLTEYDAAEASAYRWQAFANYFKENASTAQAGYQLPLTGAAQQKPLTEYNAAEAAAYRWQGIANFYAKHAELAQAKP